MDNWNKYTYVCATCDGLFEMTVKSNNEINDDNCPVCEIRSLNLLSVLDATIQPTTTKEEQMETTEKTLAEQYDNSAKIIVKNTNSGELVYDELSPYDVNCLLTDNDYLKKYNDKMQSRISSVKDILLESFADSDDQDTLRSIAEALDIQLTKTIEWSATMYVSGSIEVDLFDEFDLDSELSDNLQVSAYSGDIEVEDYSVEDARES
jgi:DNA-directed RNA polymerase subunit RPC12/RpoP